MCSAVSNNYTCFWTASGCSLHMLNPDLLALPVACCCWQSKDKTLKLVNHMWHTLIKEEGNVELLQDIVQWLDQRSKR